MRAILFSQVIFTSLFCLLWVIPGVRKFPDRSEFRKSKFAWADPKFAGPKTVQSPVKKFLQIVDSRMFCLWTAVSAGGIWSSPPNISMRKCSSKGAGSWVCEGRPLYVECSRGDDCQQHPNDNQPKRMRERETNNYSCESTLFQPFVYAYFWWGWWLLDLFLT